MAKKKTLSEHQIHLIAKALADPRRPLADSISAEEVGRAWFENDIHSPPRLIVDETPFVARQIATVKMPGRTASG